MLYAQRSIRVRPNGACLLSFDVETYFQIEAAKDVIPRADWNHLPGRLESVTGWLLEQLNDHNATATFFVLGTVAQRWPKVVQRMAEAGHEIACHGHGHDRLHTLNPQTFTEDLQQARRAIYDACGQHVVGYRAPTFSLDRTTAWAADVLTDLGFQYDSSIQPIRRGAYGVADAPTHLYRLLTSSGASLLELPPLTWQIGNYRMPVAGGGYFRLFPLWMMERGLQQVASRKHDDPPGAAMLYFHPWEFDPDQPRMPLKGMKRFRTYVGMNGARRKLERLLKRWPMQSTRDYLSSVDAANWPTWSLGEKKVDEAKRPAA